ncbi:MAG: hypothetical protein JEZ02_11925 [Desulfatibacillum sp.]|nr:hypothetical protein [Desulfatibacillum sp.]
MPKTVLSVLFFLFLLNPGMGAEPVRIDAATHNINFTANLAMAEDPGQAVTMDDILKTPLLWTENTQPYVNLGYSDSAYWFRATFDSSLEGDQTFFVEIAFPTLDHVDLYIPGETGKWQVLEGGDKVPYHARIVGHRNHIFPISVKKGKQTYYLRVQSSGTIEFHANLLTPSALLETTVRENSIIWFIYGCIIMVGLYNACVFVITRDKSYLHLVFYGATFLAIDLFHQGHLQQLFRSEPGWMTGNGLLIALSLNLFFAGAFSASFLETKAKHPVIHKVIFWFFMVPGLAYLPLSLVMEYRELVQILIKHMMIACLLLLAILFYLSIKKERQAIFLTAGYCFILVSGFISVLVFLGKLPPGIASKWVVPVGTAWLMLTFSIGLADKINIMKRRLERSDERIRIKNLELMEANSELQSINKTVEERNTELTVVHEALEISEHRLRSMIEQSPMVIELYDHRGNLVQTNKVQKDTWGGYGPVFGAEFNILKSMAMKKLPIYPIIKQVFQGQGNFVEEWSLHDGEDQKEENRRYYRSRLYPIATASGKLSNVVIMHEDITKDKRAEEILIQSEKMVSLGGLAAGMAHEINSPLAGIVQNAQVLAMRLTKPLPANAEAANRLGISLDGIRQYMETREIPRILESMQEAGKRVAETVRNMLSFSRKSDSSPVPCDLRDLIRRTVDMAKSDYDLKQRFNFRHVLIQEEFDPDTPDILCQPSQIQQVLLNILKNGAQAMASKPSENVNGYSFTLRVYPEEHQVVVEIQDNGPGMDAHTLEHVFEPFYTTKKAGEGTGLGLFLCNHIIREIHGGSLRVESEPGKGALFTISLPVAKTNGN